jgi:hydroxypyruvate isomerase
VIKLSANLSMLFHEVPLADRIGLAAGCGFRGVEVAFPYEVDPAQLGHELDRHGIEMVLINTPPGRFDAGERGFAALPGREAEFRDGFERALTTATLLRCRQVHVMSGVVADLADLSAPFDTLAANLAWAAPRAERHGIRLLIEPINRRSMPGYVLSHLSDALAVIRRVDHPNLFLQFDFFHLQIMGGDLVTRFEAALPLIAHVQIAGVPDRHEPDDSELNVPFLLGRIDALGYAGWVGCEYIPRGGTLEGLSWARPYGIGE